LEVVANHVIRITLGGGGTGAKVKDAGEVAEIAEVIDEIVRVDVVGEAERREVLPLVGFVKPVDDKDIVVTKLIQTPNDRTADETGPAGDYDPALLAHFGKQ
jgi:hypothetical protein